SETEDRTARRHAIAFVLVGYIVLDFIFLPIGRGVGRADPFTFFVVTAIIGIVLSQYACGAIWLVFGPSGIVKRSLILIGFAAAAILAFSFGLLSLRDGPPSLWHDAIRTLVTCAPIVLLSLAIPLWLARGWLRWRVELEQPTSSSRSLSILDVMRMMAVFGFALALPKFAGRGINANGVILAALAVGVTTGTLIALPIIAIAFRCRTILSGIAFTILLAFLATVSLCIVGFTLTPVSSNELARAIGMVGGLASGFMFGVALPLLLAKQWGYRLRWGKQSALDDDQETAGPLSSD
ncbi:MAG: hypothetical protein ACI9G1_002361, partial [Pirellulaceae bacterium]